LPNSDLKDKNQIFIVHGHNRELLYELNLLIEEFHLPPPLILEDKSGKGRTIIEKFEEEADKANFAFVLLTPDDMVKTNDGEYLQSRPNVIFELGWFYGRLGRNNVCIILKQGTTIHSDLQGISNIIYTSSIKEKYLEIKRELVEAGLII
jgi:predicted nucleotide-binding protein